MPLGRPQPSEKRGHIPPPLVVKLPLRASMHRLIVTDLDGTLLTEGRLSSNTIDTFRELSALGHSVAIASGRHFVDVRGVRKALGVPAHIISSNGALVHGTDDSVIYQVFIDPSIVRQIMNTEIPSAIVRNVFTSSGWLIDQESPKLLSLNQGSGFRYHLTKLEGFSGECVTKLDFVGEPSQLERLEQLIHDRYAHSVTATYSRPGCFELMARGVSKGVALTVLLKLLDLDSAVVLAFGDNLNDIEMLSVAGFPHVMGNAHPKLFELFPDAAHIGRNTEDGVAVALRRLLA
jgi:Cof subfamily protein (haloacid dehalogenase superfamily)